jgi:DNA-binding response OmpR family regulator
MKKVLIVDDQISAARLLVTLLQIDGYEARYAADWCHLVDEVQAYRPDLVILDVHLPDIDGFELLRQVRAHPEAQIAQVPVLIISALDYGHRLETSGADGFLLKPFKFDSMVEAINKIKDSRAAAGPEA